MNEIDAQWKESRKIVERVVVTGDLVLLIPTHLGNGDAEGPTGMSLLRDPLDETRALLTGTSIAGALRNYLWQVIRGYEYDLSDKGKGSVVTALFGGERSDDEGAQSLLIVDDARSHEPASVEIRDGVRISPVTGTAMVEDRGSRRQGYKFDLELLQAGTTFPLRFELLIPRGEDAGKLKAALARTLRGLERAEVSLGARKRRGFGRCRVESWRVITYDLTEVDGLLAWIDEEGSQVPSGTPMDELLGVTVPDQDARQRFTVKAAFSLDGSLLVRAQAESGVDAGHLRSYRPEQGNVPVLPGTSLAGVLRHRALRIANTLASNAQGAKLVDEMFGSSERDALTASRIIVRETVLEGVRRLVQSRVKIDRFTGGAYPTALFGEEPVFGGADSRVQIELELRNPREYQVGLLLLLLKDLWTGDLPLGGEVGVGRGRLQGIEAQLCWQCEADEDWTLTQTEERLEIKGSQARLEGYVKSLQTYLTEEDSDGPNS